MSDNEEDSHEGREDGRDRTDDRTALWDRTMGILLGNDPVPERGAEGDDRPTWEETIDERRRGDERNRVDTRAGDPAPGSRDRPSTRPDVGPHGSQRQEARSGESGRQKPDRGEWPEQQATRERSERSRASRPPKGQRHRRGRSPQSGPREDDGGHHRAGDPDPSARESDRIRSGNPTPRRRHQIGEWVPRGRIHRHSGGPPPGRSIAHARPEPCDGGEGYDEPQEVDPDQFVEPDREAWECRRSRTDPPSEAWEATLRDRRPERRQHRRWKRQFVTISRPGSETADREDSDGDRERDESEDTSRIRLG